MVRTLDFHSNNVGSNPSNPIIFTPQKLFELPRKNRPTFKYSFSFVSLIPPFTNLRFKKTLLFSTPTTKRLRFKYSYVLFTWFKHLRNTTLDPNKKRIKFVMLPARQSEYALQKAPMAHKTNSHEHFKFRFFFFYIKFNTFFREPLRITGVNKGNYFSKTLQTQFPFFETNLLLLRSFTLSFPMQASNWLTYQQSPKSRDR